MNTYTPAFGALAARIYALPEDLDPVPHELARSRRGGTDRIIFGGSFFAGTIEVTPVDAIRYRWAFALHAKGGQQAARTGVNASGRAEAEAEAFVALVNAACDLAEVDRPPAPDAQGSALEVVVGKVERFGRVLSLLRKVAQFFKRWMP